MEADSSSGGTDGNERSLELGSAGCAVRQWSLGSLSPSRRIVWLLTGPVSWPARG